MKKSFLSLVLIGACGATMAQRQVGSATHMHAPFLNDGTRTPTDTVYAGSLDGGSPTLYGVVASDGGGWLAGSNGYGDEAKAQTFLLDNAVSAEAVGVWFGGKVETSGDPNSHVAFKIYQMNGGGETLGGPITTGAPNSEWASVDVAITDIDTATGADFTWASFPAVWVTDFFSAGVDLTGLSAGDSVGIVSTAGGEIEYDEFTWERWSDNSWHTMQSAWNGDVASGIDLFIFVAIDAANVGIDDAETFNGMRMSFLNGNLVGQDVQLAYTVDQNAKMRLLVSDASGRLVLDQDLGNKAMGLHNQTINAENWNAGMYYVSLIANGKTITKKLVKE